MLRTGVINRLGSLAVDNRFDYLSSVHEQPPMPPKAQILVAEDNDQIRESLIRLLSREEFEVSGAANGNEAIPLIYGREFQIVVLDLKMPYIDGFEVLKFIKSTFPQTKVIILTASRDVKSIEQCRALGADQVIGKPYDLESLLETIEGMLEK
jgi:two-component system OmpR family response regulator